MKKTLQLVAFLVLMTGATYGQKLPKDSTEDKGVRSDIKKPDTDSIPLTKGSALLSYDDCVELGEFLSDNPKITPRARDIVMGWLYQRWQRNYKEVAAYIDAQKNRKPK